MEGKFDGWEKQTKSLPEEYKEGCKAVIFRLLHIGRRKETVD
jgi:hypothetical protein